MSTTITTESVQQTVFAGLQELGVEPADLGRDVLFESLDIDSLDLVELRQMVEEQLGVALVKEDLMEVRSIGDVIDVIVARSA